MAGKRIRTLQVSVPPSPPIAQSPGEIITTLSGTATVTRLEQVGRETIAWADYGSGIEQPHSGEAISPHPVGTIFTHQRSGKSYTLVRASAEEAVLNHENGKECISTRLKWEEVDRLFATRSAAAQSDRRFTLATPHASPQESRTNPAGKSNHRRRRRSSGNRDTGTGNTTQQQSFSHNQDVLSPESGRASEAGGQSEAIPLESPLEQGDLIRAKDHRSDEWYEGYITRLGRSYARLDNDRYTVVLEGAELLKRNPLPFHLLKIVGLPWAEQADRLLDHLHFGNLNCFYVAGKSAPLEEYRGWTIGTAPNGNRQDFEISKGSSAWFLRDKQHDRLKTDDRRIAWCRHAVDHVERQLARLDQLTTGSTRIDSQPAPQLPPKSLRKRGIKPAPLNPPTRIDSLPLEQCLTPSDSLKASADLPELPNCSEDSGTGNSLKSIPTASKSSAKTFLECPSGQTSGTITLTPENLTSSPADSPARICPQLITQERDSQEGDRDSGLKCSELSEKPSPDSPSSKTSPQLKTGIGLPPSWKDWLESGLMLNGKLSQRQGWAHPTSESGCSLLPTPIATDYKGNRKSKSSNGGLLEAEALSPHLLATPCSRDGKGARKHTKGGRSLPSDLKLLPTPLSSDRGSVREDFSPTLNIVLKQPNLVCNPEVWEWMMGFPPGWTELPTADGGQKTHLPETPECRPSRLPSEVSASKLVATLSLPSKPVSPSPESCGSQDCSRGDSAQSCDTCHHQERHEALQEEAYTCKLGHVIGSVMCGGVMAQSYPQICKAYESPLEREADRAEVTHDTIARLEQERDRIKSEGVIAPDGCWIETGKVKGRNFRQAWWRASKPLFTPKRSRGNVEAKVKSQYIGEEGSPEHKEAMAQRERRDRLKAIEKQLQILMEECDR